MRTFVKRFVSVLMVLSLVLSMALTVGATENEPLLSLNGPAAVLHDSEFSLTLDSSSAAVADGKVTVSYDTNGLYFLGAEAGSAWPEAADLSLQVNDNGNGKLVLAFAGAVNAEAGTLVTLNFKTNEVLEPAEFSLNGDNSYVTGYNGTLAGSLTVERVCHAAGYPDVVLGSFYHEGVDYVVEHGYMTGLPGGIFAPSMITNRATMATIFYRMAGEPAVTGEHPFTDVPDGRFYSEAVLWAYQNGLVKGVTATTFCPDDSIVREQMATFFCRYAEFIGLDVNVELDLSGFHDADLINNYAKAPMQWAVANGLVKGMPGDLLDPRGVSNRAQIATILVRFAALLEN